MEILADNYVKELVIRLENRIDIQEYDTKRTFRKMD